jgi:ABC-type transport system involved in cytochrome c biogenesis permease subunit
MMNNASTMAAVGVMFTQIALMVGASHGGKSFVSTKISQKFGSLCT